MIRISNMVGKYGGISNDTFLVKALLQLGLVVTLPLALEESGYLHEHHARLVHPFVWRKTYVSAFRVVSLRITEEDMDVLRDRSEGMEARGDQAWEPFVQGRAPLRNPHLHCLVIGLIVRSLVFLCKLF